MKRKRCRTAVGRKIKTGIIASLVLMLCIFLRYAYIRNAEGYHIFGEPEHEPMAVQGVPGGENLWHYKELPVKEGYVVGIDTAPRYRDGRLYLNMANREDNTVWFLARVYHGDTLVAETGIFYPGEFVGNVSCSGELADSDSILVKIFAYEPETYHSEGVAQISCALTAE